MTRAVWAALLPLLLAGCVTPDVPGFLRRGDDTPTDWEVEVEPSMAPDFSGMGETYPVLLLHEHHVASLRDREEARRNPAVCLTTKGAPMPTLGPATADAAAASRAPCMGPAADAPTGRLFVDRGAFDAQRPEAVVVRMDACSGGAMFLGASERAFVIRAPGHDFHVEWSPDGAFLVDGTRIAPGTSLKIGYFLHEGDRMDEEYHRYVFDVPGEWLVARVGPPTDEPPLPPRPSQGTGLALDVALAPASWREPVEAALRATPGDVLGVAEMRAVHDGERLTELTVRFATATGSTTWYGAGRTGNALRLLGAEDSAAPEDAGVAANDLFAALDLEWSALRAGVAGATTDVRLAPDTAWSTIGPLALTFPTQTDAGACDGTCAFLDQGAGWARLVAPQQSSAQGARTLAVLAYGEGAATEVWWHAV